MFRWWWAMRCASCSAWRKRCRARGADITTIVRCVEEWAGVEVKGDASNITRVELT